MRGTSNSSQVNICWKSQGFLHLWAAETHLRVWLLRFAQRGWDWAIWVTSVLAGSWQLADFSVDDGGACTPGSCCGVLLVGWGRKCETCGSQYLAWLQPRLPFLLFCCTWALWGSWFKVLCVEPGMGQQEQLFGNLPVFASITEILMKSMHFNLIRTDGFLDQGLQAGSMAWHCTFRVGEKTL